MATTKTYEQYLEDRDTLKEDLPGAAAALESITRSAVAPLTESLGVVRNALSPEELSAFVKGVETRGGEQWPPQGPIRDNIIKFLKHEIPGEDIFWVFAYAVEQKLMSEEDFTQFRLDVIEAREHLADQMTSTKRSSLKSLVAIRGLEMPTGDKRCKLCVKHQSPLFDEELCACCCELSLERYGCTCTHTVRCCVVTLTHCEGLESDKADDCSMFELDDKGSPMGEWTAYVEVKP